MRHLNQYINEFLVNTHTKEVNTNSFFGDDIPDEYKEISGKRIRVFGRIAVTSSGEESIWYMIWKYFAMHPEKSKKEAWEDLGFPDGYYSTTLNNMLRDNMIVRTARGYYEAIHPKYWNLEK